MKTRGHERETAALLRDISMYRVLAEEQLLRLHSRKEEKVRKILIYLVRQSRVWEMDGCYCATPDCMEEPVRGLLAAVWVLADFIDRGRIPFRE